jgi:hypothetical protein
MNKVYVNYKYMYIELTILIIQILDSYIRPSEL